LSGAVRHNPLSSATVFWYQLPMNAKHRRTLEAIFARPVQANIRWADIEALLVALGAERSEGRGSRVRFSLNGEDATFHRPHPQPEAIKPAVKAACSFLERAGIAHDDDDA
jgi:hypothetical protein